VRGLCRLLRVGTNLAAETLDIGTNTEDSGRYSACYPRPVDDTDDRVASTPTFPDMEVTQQQACRILTKAGLHRPAAVGLLRAGFAGPARRVGGTSRVGKLLYREQRVWDLVVRPMFGSEEPTHALDPAALVIRTGPRRPDQRSGCGWSGVDLSAPMEDQFEAVRRTRAMSMAMYATAVIARQIHGTFPLVVTVSSFVALGADVVAIDVTGGRTVLTLQPPGSWFDPLRHARLDSGPGPERRWLAIEERFVAGSWRSSGAD
jgi:hypothetical protein